MFNRPSDNRFDNNIIAVTISAIFTIFISAYIAYQYLKARGNKKLTSIHIPTKRIKQEAVSPKLVAVSERSIPPRIDSPSTSTNASSSQTKDSLKSDEKGATAVSSSSVKTESTQHASSQAVSSYVPEVKSAKKHKPKESAVSAKSLAIKQALQQKKDAKEQEKQRALVEDAKLEAAREQEKKLWKEKVLKEKQAAREKAAIEAEKEKLEKECKKEEAVSSSSVVESPVIPSPPKKSPGYEARKAMIRHTRALALFQYDENVNSKQAAGHTALQTLGFLFHFHRYNLSRRILKDMIFDREKSVELRTLMVHAINRTHITPHLIMETKAGLCQFMVREVNRVMQVHGSHHVFVRKSREVELLETLTGASVDAISLMSMEELKLVRLLSASEHEINEHASSPCKIKMGDQYEWFVKKVIPLINLIQNYDGKDKKAMLSMVIIIAGEYCSNESCMQMLNHLRDRKDLTVSRSYFVKFMQKCREIRNDLSHDIFEPDAEKIEKLLQKANRITPTTLALEEVVDALLPEANAAAINLDVMEATADAALK